MQVPQSIALRHFFFCRPLSDFVSVRPYRFTEISDTPDSTSSTDVSLRTHFSSSTRLHFMPANSPSAANGRSQAFGSSRRRLFHVRIRLAG